jgi:hypothetical protein
MSSLAAMPLAARATCDGRQQTAQRPEMSGDLRKFMPARNTNGREAMPDAAHAAGVARQPAAFPALPAGIHA